MISHTAPSTLLLRYQEGIICGNRDIHGAEPKASCSFFANEVDNYLSGVRYEHFTYVSRKHKSLYRECDSSDSVKGSMVIIQVKSYTRDLCDVLGSVGFDEIELCHL